VAIYLHDEKMNFIQEIGLRNKAGEFLSFLSKKWADQDKDVIGFAYVNGYVRSYNGRKDNLPKIHVARRRFCTPATTDFWINDANCEPLFFVTAQANDSLFSMLEKEVSTLELLVGNYARRWRVENVISEAVKFFNLNALSSPILVKVHFDVVVMTMIADILYNMLAQKLRGFQDCDAPKIFRHFVKGKANITVKNGELTVTYPRRAHNPLLRVVPWHRLPKSISWLDSINLNLKFR
jgi:Transposase protein